MRLRRALYVGLFATVVYGTTTATAQTSAANNVAAEPFGLTKIVAPQNQNRTSREWQKLASNIQGALQQLKQCRSEPDRCSSAERRFEDLVKEAKAKKGRARIEFVNERINGSIRYTSDQKQWAADDAWSLPIDASQTGSLNKGFGDCEDYAIAKYATLHQSGVPDADLRLVLGHDSAAREDHAVLAVRHDQRWLILDNRWNALHEDRELPVFKPIFVVERTGVKRLAKMFRLSGKPVLPP